MPQMLYTGSDRQAIGGFSLELLGSKVEFQFPPRIPSDGRSGDWEDKPSAVGWEPAAFYRGAGARTITLEFDYIYDGRTWTADKITKQLRLCRGYYTAPAFDKGGGSQLVGKIKISKHGGNTPMSCRLTATDVKHAGPLIRGELYLKSTVTLTIKIWGNANENKQIQPIQNILQISPDWY